MKRYGSRRSDNEIGHDKVIHGAKSSRARAKREACEHHEITIHVTYECACCGTPMEHLGDDDYVPEGENPTI